MGTAVDRVTGRWLGIDWGERWFGVAATDPRGVLALPLKVLDGEEAFYRFLDDYLAQEPVIGLVVGLPRNMDGTEGPSAASARRLAEALEARLASGEPPVPRVVLWDERLSSFQAEEALRPTGRRTRRADSVAAQILLQSFIDSLKGEVESTE